MNDIALSRRALIARLGGAALFARMGRMNALAQASSSDYKALVCIFLLGGNDGITPSCRCAAQFDAYKAARGSLALPDGNGPAGAGDSTAHGDAVWTERRPQSSSAAMAAGQTCDRRKRGMIVQPTTRTQFLTNAVPADELVLALRSGDPDADWHAEWHRWYGLGRAHRGCVVQPLNAAPYSRRLSRCPGQRSSARVTSCSRRASCPDTICRLRA